MRRAFYVALFAVDFCGLSGEAVHFHSLYVLSAVRARTSDRSVCVHVHLNNSLRKYGRVATKEQKTATDI